ncbi:hypothetical protein OAB74_02205 [Candidatus Pelagibacter sp.]|nr:hypothetical protein [Candidatus Pelagibacter sp.]
MDKKKDLKKFFLSRPEMHNLSKNKIEELNKLYASVYTKKFHFINEAFAVGVLSRSITKIIDAKIVNDYYPYFKNTDKITIAKSSNDLWHLIDNNNLFNSINNILKEKKLGEFVFDYKIFDHNKKYKNLKIYFLSLIINKFFNLFREKVLFEVINIKLFIKTLFKKKSPQFFVQEKYNLVTNSYYNSKIRKKIFDDLITKFSEDLINYKNINIQDIYVTISLLPINLVENFSDIYFYIKNKENNKIKRIVVSHMMKDDLVNFWIINQKININAKLDIWQHGAGFFFMEYDSTLNTEIEVADTLYTWSKINSDKIKQIHLNRHIKHNFNAENDLLVITSDWQRFDRFNSGPIFELIQRNLNEQIIFLKNITFTKKIKVKQPPNIYNNFFQYYKENNLQNYVTNENIYKLMESNKISICTYFGSTFFELMSNDKPFIIFTRISEYSFNNKAKKYIKKLKKFNCWHNSGLAASNFLNKNYKDYLDTWSQKEFREFREDFKSNFCMKPGNWQKKLLD